MDVPNSNAKIIRSIIFEQYVVRCGSKNGHQMMCLKEIGLSAQNMLTILSSIIYMFEDLYDHLLSTRILSLIMNRILI